MFQTFPTSQHMVDEFGRRILRKIHSVGYRPELFCYLLVEEFLILFNVPGVYVRVVGRGLDGATIDADSNIRDMELAALTGDNLFGTKAEELSHSTVSVVNGVTVRSIRSNAGRSNLSNGNLHSVDTQVEIKVADEVRGLALNVLLWFDRKAKDSFRPCLEASLSGRLSWHFLLAQLQSLLASEYESLHLAGDLISRTGDTTVLDGDSGGFAPLKNRFMREVDASRESDVAHAYRERFLPLVRVANRVQHACRHLVVMQPGTIVESDFLISYRTTKERGISFLLTEEQVSRLLRESFRDLRTILEEVFVIEGLSGYVLQTAHSEFCPEPEKDPRWARQANSPDTEIHRLIGILQTPVSATDVEGRLRVRAAQRNTLLMPLCIERSNSRKRKLLGDSVAVTSILMFVECRLPEASSEQVDVRKRLFDLAWEFMPVIEAAIEAQSTTEEMIQSQELREQDLARWASLVHDLPKQVVIPTERAVKNAKREFDWFVTDLQQSLIQDRMPMQRIDRIQDELDYAIMKTQHAVSLLYFASPKTRRRGQEMELRPFNARKFANEVERFVRSSVERKYGPKAYQPLDTSEPQQDVTQHIRCHIDIAANIPQINVAEHLLYTMVCNHLENSFKQLVSKEDLVLSDPDRGLITVGVSYLERDNCLCIEIADRGPGIADEKNGTDFYTLSERQADIAGVLRGRFPGFEKMISTNGGMGVGILNNASMILALNDDESLGKNGNLKLLPRRDRLEGLLVVLTVPAQLQSARRLIN